MVQLTTPVKIPDFSKAAAILVGGLLIFVLLLNAFAPQFAIGLNNIIFVLILIGFVFAFGKFMFFRNTRQPITIEIILLYGGVVAVGIFLLIKFPQIAPSFSVQTQSIMSAVGLS